MRLTFTIAILLICTACTTEQAYRLPFADGVEVRITADPDTHVTPVADMYDMQAVQRNQIVAAAAEGWVRFIKDSASTNIDNDPNATNNYIWIEHPLDYCQPTDDPTGTIGIPGEGTCKTCPAGLGKCNEWTLYAHIQQDTARGFASLSENDWVVAGQPIGIEGDVGIAAGRHVHFHVFTIDLDLPTKDNLQVPTENGDYNPWTILHGRSERIPLFCTAAGLRSVKAGETHVAAPCPF
ncbi:MAG: M23 family metallopeptidase [Betaproteobacteria bacterium]|nr:M23 family metallopeptidase [Betaproteobacteria bacterium]